MSLVKIRAALETALNGMSPSLATAWENVAFVPPAPSVAYQRAFLLPATPLNSAWGPSHQELGIFQVTLCYPPQTGAGASSARAELIRTTFRRGISFLNSGVTVTILKTPEVGSGTFDGDRFTVPVKIRYMAQVA